jgi:hypothetical protein
MRPLDKAQFLALPDKLREDLRAITPSMDGDLTYWPCSARMKGLLSAMRATGSVLVVAA